MNNLLLEFSLLFGVAVAAGMLIKFFRLPPIIGYLIAGVVISLLGMQSLVDKQLLDFFSSYGVMLLLFLVGLEMNVSELGRLGKGVVVVGIGQLVLTTSLIFLVMQLSGGELKTVLFLSIVLTLSSTIIVVKLLSEKHDLESLYGKVGIGILLIQDLAAILIMLSLNNTAGSGGFAIIIKLLIIFIISGLAAKNIMPKILHRIARSTDELILFSLAWCFIFSSVVGSELIGLSVEIGGFLAGLALSGSFEHSHIVNKIKPLRDFFLTIFFVSLGLSMKLETSTVVGILWIIPMVVIVKPLIVWFLMRLSGYRQRPAFLVGNLFGQVSEFGLVLSGMGMRQGLISQTQMAGISVISIISMALSAYSISFSFRLYQVFKPLLDRIWPDKEVEEVSNSSLELSGHVVLMGCHRMGQSILSHLERNHEKVLVVDFDPEIVNKLTDLGKNVIYGDIADVEIYTIIALDKAKIIISTVKDIKDSLVLLAEVRKQKLLVPVVVDAETIEEAMRLYEEGAAYVVFPHFVGGLHLSDLIKRGKTVNDFRIYREAQAELMKGAFGE